MLIVPERKVTSSNPTRDEFLLSWNVEIYNFMCITGWDSFLDVFTRKFSPLFLRENLFWRRHYDRIFLFSSAKQIITYSKFLQMVKSLARKDDSPSALSVILNAINSQSNFNDDSSSPCVTCTEPKALKKCSKCRAVQYCDRECQRLHWFVHKKECARSSTNSSKASEQSEADAESCENVSDNVANLKIWSNPCGMHTLFSLSFFCL